MSDLLNKYRESRASNGVLRSSPARRVSSLYPKLSSLDRDTSDYLDHDHYRRTSRLRSEEHENDRSYRPTTTSSIADKYNFTSQPRRRTTSTTNPQESFATRKRRYDLDDTNSKTTERISGKYLGSPIRSINNTIRRRDPSYTRSSVISDNYRISKPSTPSHGNGFLSKLVNFFTANGDEEDQAESSEYFLKSPKKVSFDKKFDFDEVDEVINRGKLREKEEELEKYRILQRDHQKLLTQLENENYEKKKLNSELQNLKIKNDVLENDLFNKNVEIDQLVNKHRQELERLNNGFELEYKKLQTLYNKNLKELESTIEKNNHQHEQTSNTQRQEITKLENKIHELDEKLFDTNFELKQQTKELNSQISRNNSIQIEMSLKDRFKSSKEEEINNYYLNSSKIDQEIRKLQNKIGNNNDFPTQSTIFQKTENNIEQNLKILNEMIQHLNFNQLDKCENYYDKAYEFINSNTKELEDIIKSLKQSSNPDLESILIEYLNLKKLNELNYHLSDVKELINDCKILRDFVKDYDLDTVDLAEIYCKIKSETL
ncbi:uncharacterized protein KGF55_003827 [Candida pseudojiufengensis]|uniref:uncharacterized protein n=1 Tax=Candida pseudojiufengensis TaxID=497109 RepID=UPI0022242947|nr:uncharacterized protein KGF55_003827 [Candida pseudojiufengensis]KAI5961856.1 hypothetical protein KGF55_003827 [Candida pseudojiufengensis]